MEEQNKKKYQHYGVPQSLFIEGYKYSYKTNSKDETKFIYRCNHRNSKAQIIINKENILKVIIKKGNANVEFIKGKNSYICPSDKANSNSDVLKPDSILTNEELNELGYNLIKQHLDKPLSFHMDILKKNKIPFEKFKIKNLLQKCIEESFPEDANFFDNLEYIKITYDPNNDEFKDLLFCYVNIKFLNISKNNRQENIVIFTSEVQLKKLEAASQILMDTTFRSCPKKFDQLFNIIAVIEKNDFIFPIAHILMTHKSCYSYETIFKNINPILEEMNINFSFNKSHIMTDFEHVCGKLL